MTEVVHETAQFEDYRTVVGVTPRSHRPIYGTRYLTRCTCGWSSSGGDYISTKKAWRIHLGKGWP